MKKKSGMSGLLIFGILVMGGFGGLIMIMLIICGTGEMAEPVEIPATREEAYAYQYIGTELGIAWDMSMLCDAIRATTEGKSSISSYNPLVTSLQFVTMTEELYINNVTYDVSGNAIDNWVLSTTMERNGANQILEYIDKVPSDLATNEPSSLITELNTKAEEKSATYSEAYGYGVKYVLTFTENTDYMGVLTLYAGIPTDKAYIVTELHDSLYLYYLYDFLVCMDGIDEVTLPTVTVGNVTRQDLANVATSIIGWPYLMGGKSPGVGSPIGPLDCSGYVDWVYFQCFGQSITTGSNGVPDGVSIAGTALMWYACEPIEESALKVGDLGFISDPATMADGDINHVGIYIGEINGNHAFIHCGGSYYGSVTCPTGRVGISISACSNNYNPVDGSYYLPTMKKCTFNYFRRPMFTFME